MRIVNRQEFLQLPSGTVYSKYKSMGMISGLYEKFQSSTNDWVYQDLISCIDADSSAELFDLMDAAMNGKEFSLDLDCGERDGCYDESDMFAIYDKKDLDKLIVRLIEVLNRSKEDESND